MLTRRRFVATGACAATSGLAACATPPNLASPTPAQPATPAAPVYPPLPAFYGAVDGEPYPVPAIPEGTLDPQFWRREVPNRWPDKAPGTIIVDPDAAILHFILDEDTALRYGVSVGAEGFGWDGTARLQFQRKWPRWNPPDSMVERKPELEPFSIANGGMDPGPGNPLGARALYLFDNGVDTLYRVHGDASPRELGKAVSSGCIRMLNQDVIDLYDRAVHGADVVVLTSFKGDGIPTLY